MTPIVCAGIDHSKRSTGVAVLEIGKRKKKLHLFNIKSYIKNDEMSYFYTTACLINIIERFKIEKVWLEEFAFNQGQSRAITGQAELIGMLKWNLNQYNITFKTIVTQSMVKTLTGSGANALKKERVMDWSLSKLIELKQDKYTLNGTDLILLDGIDDVSDAMGLLYAGIMTDNKC